MSAREFHFTEVVFQFAILFGQFRAGDQITRGRIRIGERKGLALGVVHRSNACVLAGKTDREIARRSIKVLLGQRQVNSGRIGKVNLCIGRRTEPRHIKRAAQQALDHTIIVGRGEQLYRNAQRCLDGGAVTFLRIQPVLGVFAAKNADVKFSDGMAVSQCSTRHRGRCHKGNSKLFHQSSPV